MIEFSAPGKIHLLGEHTVVYGKPALLATVGLRVTVTLNPLPNSITYNDTIVHMYEKLKKIVESVVKKKFNITKISPYRLKITSQLPIGGGLGSSAAVSAAYLGALITFLGYPWDVKLINELTLEAEKVFHGNPSGGDNTVVVYGGLLWYRKETEPVKLFSQIKQFVLIDSGKPMESTKEMVGRVRIKQQESRIKVQKIFDDQERLVKELVVALKDGDQNQLVSIIRQGETNLDRLGVVGKKAQHIIRLVEKVGGAAKIMGGGGVKSGSGMLLAYHPDPKILSNLTKTYHLPVLSVKLGEEGLRRED